MTDASRSLLTPATPGSHADDDAAFARCVAESSKTHRLAIEAVPEVAGKPLSPGAKFRLRVATQDAGDVYLFAIDGQNHPVAAFAQTDAPAALPGRPVLLPAAGTPFSLAADPVGGVPPTFVAILVRRPDASAAPAANPGAAASGSARSEANPPPVVVLDASAKHPVSPTADPLVARLMALLKTKSAADILAARVTVEAGK